jgi:hypothetical protein
MIPTETKLSDIKVGDKIFIHSISENKPRNIREKVAQLDNILTVKRIEHEGNYVITEEMGTSIFRPREFSLVKSIAPSKPDYSWIKIDAKVKLREFKNMYDNLEVEELDKLKELNGILTVKAILNTTDHPPPRIQVEELSGRSFTFDNLDPVTEVSQPYKNGDMVRVIGNSTEHMIPIGTIIIIRTANSYGSLTSSDG